MLVKISYFLAIIGLKLGRCVTVLFFVLFLNDDNID